MGLLRQLPEEMFWQEKAGVRLWGLLILLQFSSIDSLPNMQFSGGVPDRYSNMRQQSLFTPETGVLGFKKRFSGFSPSLEEQGMLLGMGKRARQPLEGNDVDVLPNKRYTSFMPSLEDQGMMIGMGKRSSWERSDLPWPKRWYSSAGKNKKFSNFQSFGPSVADDGMLLAMG